MKINELLNQRGLGVNNFEGENRQGNLIPPTRSVEIHKTVTLISKGYAPHVYSYF